MKALVRTLTGSMDSEVDLPPIFETPYRYDIIHKAYVALDSHHYQPKGVHPTAGQDVSADSLDPPTGHGQSRVARIRGGGRRQGQAAEVASTRGGRQAHPPKSQRVIYKKLNKKENRLALCSAVAATAARDMVESRGHIIRDIESLPILVEDDAEEISKTKELLTLLDKLGLSDDINRLKSRRARSGKSLLRGRGKKIGKSVLIVAESTDSLSQACSAIPGVEAVSAKNLSVLDLAPGSSPGRLTVYTEAGLESLSKINSPHLELMVTLR